jgi:hypothetical protein
MTTALANVQGALNPLKEVTAESVLARYLAEETTTQIAKSLGVTRSALNYWLLEHCEKEWKSAQIIRAMKRKEDAEDAIETAPDALTLARAREALRAAQWDLERVCRRIYGQDAPPNAGAGVNININLRRAPLDIVGEADVTIANESK